MVEQLGEQTEAELTLDNELLSVELDAHQQVHLLQLIREATLNAIKHANATAIHIECKEANNWVTIAITDDGEGFDSSSSKLNHYGMTIMQERAARLNGDLSVAQPRAKVVKSY